MIRVVATPREDANLFDALVKAEARLKTFYRAGRRRKGHRRWRHENFGGWVDLHKSLGGITVACVQARDPDDEWQMLSAFIGLLYRRFKESLSNISISHETG